jgi:hypothetical protein
VARSVAEPVETDSVNVGGTIEVVLAAARAGRPVPVPEAVESHP